MKFDLEEYHSLPTRKLQNEYRRLCNNIVLAPYQDDYVPPKDNPPPIETPTHDEMLYGDGRMRREYPGLEEALEKEF